MSALLDASLIKADVDKTKRIPGDQPFAWPKAEEASHAVREYLVALDAARGEEDRDAICAHETDSQARPLSAAGPERRQGRSAAYSNRAEPEADRQASLPCTPPPLGAACLA
jgi:hypothetical protein